MRRLFSIVRYWVHRILLCRGGFAQVDVGIAFRSAPELPVYEQPICPGEGYIWTPGYWAWNGDDYYWCRGHG